MQRAERPFLHDGCLCVVSGSTGAVRIHVHECVESGIQVLDLRQMRVNKFDRRDFFLSDLFGHRNGRKEV